MKNAFIIDDDADILEVLKTSLAFDGFDVHLFYDFTQALRCIPPEKPCLVLMDIFVPDKITAPVFVAELRQRTKSSNIVAFSAHPHGAYIAKGFQADDFVEKPFDIVFMGQLVGKYCEKLHSLV